MKMKTFLCTIVLTAFVLFAARAQDSTANFSWSGYMEAYYSYDFNEPADGNRAPFVYSFNRHNEINVNLGFLKAAYHSQTIRGNMAIMTGTYANANLADEPGVLRNILEANAGAKLSTTKNIWIDAGIFASHIGFENTIGKDSWNLTRSILADNTPYFESGVKVSYTSDNAKWFLAGFVLNGWQRIQRVPGNSLPSFGTQVTFTPTDKVLFNSSTFAGTETPDSARLMRYFHNFYSILQLTNNLGLTLGVDYGVQQSRPASNSFDNWWSPIVIARVTISNKVSMDFRAEYFDDDTRIIIVTENPYGFKTSGVSSNLDYKISDNAMWRIEVRNFHSKHPAFTRGSEMVRDNTFVTTSLAISF